METLQIPRSSFVTGATGFVGSAVVRQLLEAGSEVAVLVRPGSQRDNLAGLPVEIIVGDLADTELLTRGMAGRQALFHVAADYRLWSRRPQDLYESNVDGTAHAMEAALRSGVERIVYTSSVATLATASQGVAGSEARPGSLDDMIGHYKRSKFLAEQLVREWVAQRGLPAVIVNPSTPIGPGDIKPTPTGKIIRDAAAGRIPAFVDTGLNLVHVDDVARGHLQAWARGAVGECYVLGGEDMTLRQILTEVASLMGRSPPRVRIPYALAYAVAVIAETAATLLGQDEPLATREGVRMSRKLMYFSSDKAQRELGYHSRPALEALRAAVDWFSPPAAAGGPAPGEG